MSNEKKDTLQTREGIAPPRDSASLRFFYHTALGRLLLRPLISRGVSKLCGRFMDSRLSKPMIRRFVKKNGIDLSQFHSDGFTCFNDCFCSAFAVEPDLKNCIGYLGLDGEVKGLSVFKDLGVCD